MRERNRKRAAQMRELAAQSVLDAATVGLEPNAAKQSRAALQLAIASRHGAHETHDMAATGVDHNPLIFCRRFVQFASTANLSPQLTQPCLGSRRRGRWVDWELKLLEAGIRPGPGANVPCWARVTCRCTEG